MGKYNLLIAEKDERYIKNLMYYISQNYSNKFNTTCFTDYKELEERIKINNNRVDIILTSPDFSLENIINQCNKTVIILTENMDKYKQYPCIKKFQSADKICSEIIKIHENKVKERADNMQSTKVFTFYSPIGGIGTSTLAVSTAYNLAENDNRVLYLNFENIQSTNIFFSDSAKSKYNFSDLLINIRNRNENISDILNLAINKINEIKLYYFNSTESILDIEELTAEDVKILIESIEKSGLFDFVIIDMPSVLDTKYYCIFQKSTNVLVAIGQDKRSNYKIDTLFNQLDGTENFLFIVNKFSRYKERLIPKVIEVNSKPVIETIDFYEEIEGNYNLQDIYNLTSYKKRIDEIINSYILN